MASKKKTKLKNRPKPEGEALQMRAGPTILTSRAFEINATAFISGGAVMTIELLGARILAPFFGTSIFTWTALIAVTMVSLSIGYYLGGRLADKKLSFLMLYKISMAAGGVLMVVPIMRLPVLKITFNLGLRMGALSSSFVLFAVPLTLLGMVLPYVIKLSFRDREVLGRTVGSLYAVSTAGSLFGTILTGFFLVQYFGNLQILAGCAGILLLLSAIAFFINREGQSQTIISLILFLCAAASMNFNFTSTSHASEHMSLKVIHRANSKYGNLNVIERHTIDDSGRIKQRWRGLFNDGLCQGLVMWPNGAPAVMFLNVIKGISSRYFEKPQSCLCLGVGPGTIPMFFANKGARVDAVEINSKTIEIAEKYFNFGHKNIVTHVEDGRTFLNRTLQQYDIIVFDAFLGESVPVHLLSLESIKAVDRHLNPDGVLVLNFLANRYGPGRKSLVAVYSTLKRVFSNVTMYSEKKETTTNVYFEASHIEGQFDPIVNNVPVPLIPTLEEIAATAFTMTPNPGKVLTDNFNPLAVLILPAAEQFRRETVETNTIELFL